MGFEIKKQTLKRYYEESGVTEAVIPKYVTTISVNAFCGCRSLKRIVIPESVTRIMSNCTFDGCTQLEEIIVSENNPVYFSHDGILYDREDEKEQSDLYFCPVTKTEVSVLSGAKGIRNGAFHNCVYLKRVTLPESLVKIGSSAFANCEALEEIHLPEGLENIGGRAFQKCTSLKEIRLPEQIRGIRLETFSHCRNLERVIFSQNVRNIGGLAFYGCQKLKEAEFPAVLERIKNAAFTHTGLISVRLPENMIVIDSMAFLCCKNLKSIFCHGAEFRIGEWDMSRVLNVLVNQRFHLEESAEILSKVIDTYSETGNPSAYAYLEQHFMEIFRILIEQNQPERIQKFLHSGMPVTEDTLSDLMMFANEKQRYEIQVMLTEFKNQNIGYASEDILKKFEL